MFRLNIGIMRGVCNTSIFKSRHYKKYKYDADENKTNSIRSITYIWAIWV